MKIGHSDIVAVFDEMWREGDIRHDYEEGFLLREESVRCSIYYHFRRRLASQFPSESNVRMFAQHQGFRSGGGSNFIPDLIVAKVIPASYSASTRLLQNRIDEVLAIVEIKYQNPSMSYVQSIEQDCKKLEEYRAKPKCSNAELIGVFMFDSRTQLDPSALVSHRNVRQYIGVGVWEGGWRLTQNEP